MSPFMAEITLRVIDGADRGRVFDELRTPVTIGREEGNSVQLNDDRVSRFHVKIQEDNERLVLTDLESTNGTKVNGEDIQLRILRYGDMISLGRSVLLFGSREQIEGRLRELRAASGEVGGTASRTGESDVGSSLDFEVDVPFEGETLTLQHQQAPEIPERLSPAQAAQLCELLEYIHHRQRQLIASVKPQGTTSPRVTLEPGQWQQLIDLQARLAEYLRSIGDPGN
jgi:pSer/pThr/pTyr-binding forkhead associated (FHA) protein